MRISLNNPAQQIWFFLLLLATVMLSGTLGYSLLEGWPLKDSLWFTFITLTTIGYNEIHPLQMKGRIFTILLVAGGMSIVFYTLQNTTRLLVEGQFKKYISRRKREKLVKKMKDHYIVCGFGRTGRKICEELKIADVPFVVVERNPELVQSLADIDHNVVQGEATDDEILYAAGVNAAKALISAVDSPTDNVFIVLTARGLNPKLHIVARAESPDTERKLIRAGANKVILPHGIGGRQMALAALRPSVVRFLELTALRDRHGIQMEEVRLESHSELCGLTLREAALSQRFGLVVIGMIGPDDDITFNPGPETKLKSGYDLILFGSNQQLGLLEKIASGMTTLESHD
jgi:voltage-gated potassium channel